MFDNLDAQLAARMAEYAKAEVERAKREGWYSTSSDGKGRAMTLRQAENARKAVAARMSRNATLRANITALLTDEWQTIRQIHAALENPPTEKTVMDNLRQMAKAGAIERHQENSNTPALYRRAQG